MKHETKQSILLWVPSFILLSILNYYISNSIKIFLFLEILITIIIFWSLYHDIVLVEKIKIRRKNNFLKLLKTTFPEGDINDSEEMEINIRNEKILITLNMFKIGRTIKNQIIIHLEITNIDERLKGLCRIKYNCAKIKEQEYITLVEDQLINSISYLVKKTPKIIESTIAEYQYYIKEKQHLITS